MSRKNKATVSILGIVFAFSGLLFAEDVVESNRKIVRNLKPEKVFGFFADLSAVPRVSGNCDAVADRLVRFAEQRKLEVRRGTKLHRGRPVPNVLIRKPGSNSVSKKPLAIQAHMDMVGTRSPDSTHDFSVDPIRFVLEGNRLRANGTTLGADNGIGLAVALALLDAEDVTHPPLEVVFTIDEETDMKGAKMIGPDDLHAERLINIDALDAGVGIVAGTCGLTGLLDVPLRREPAAGKIFCELDVSGLQGGHSGFLIHKQQANACVTAARFLNGVFRSEEKTGVAILDFRTDKNAAKNAICDFVRVTLALDSEDDYRHLTELARSETEKLRHEYRISDPEIQITLRRLNEAPSHDGALAPKSRDRLLQTMLLLPLGAWRFSQEDLVSPKPYDKILVETSCNLGVLDTQKNRALLTLYARGMEDSPLEDFSNRLECLAILCDGKFEIVNQSEVWRRADPPNSIQRLFQDEGYVLVGAHAGFECGIFEENFKRAGKTLETVTVGAQIYGAHSPSETLLVDSVEPLWYKILAVLEKLAREP